MRRTFSFGKIAYETNKKRNLVEIDIELKEREGLTNYETGKKENGYVFTASGAIWDYKHDDHISGGQNLDEIAQYINDHVFLEIYQLWQKYHLNDMNAGTKKQEQAIKEWEEKGNKYEYSAACEYLKSIDLYQDGFYKYGHSWLCMPIPENDILRIKEIINQQ